MSDNEQNRGHVSHSRGIQEPEVERAEWGRQIKRTERGNPRIGARSSTVTEQISEYLRRRKCIHTSWRFKAFVYLSFFLIRHFS